MNGSFAASLAEFAEQAKGAIDTVFREVIIEIGSSVITMSPVDTGRFKGNWQYSINSPAQGTLDRLDPNGTAAHAELVDGALQFKAGQTAYIVNNLPYAIRLEYGYSDFTPDGMVRVTLERFQDIVEEAIRKHRV